MAGDTVYLWDLVAQVQDRADLGVNTLAYPNTYIIELLNKANRRLNGLLCETGEDYAQSDVIFTAVANVTDYWTTDNVAAGANIAGSNVLPIDVYQVRLIGSQAVTPGQYIPLSRGTVEETYDVTGLGGWPWPWPQPRYQILGSGSSLHVRFMPPFQSGILVDFRYFPVPPLLANMATNGDSIDAHNGWDVYVVDWAARRAAEKDENYELCGRLDQSILEFEIQLKRESANRNAGQPAKVIRRRSRRNGWRGSGWGGPMAY